MQTAPTPNPAQNARPRDRGRTEAAILAAARQQLAEGGFQNFGVNTVARRAGCDKQLIYRYFGGLEGLTDAIGAGLATWLEDSVATRHATPPQTYAELAERLILGFLEALRANLLVQRIIAWEVADPSPLVARMAAARGAALGAWFQRTKGDLQAPPGVDAPALNTLLIAAAQHLVLSGATARQFAGIPLASEADWGRIEDAMRAMIRALYP